MILLQTLEKGQQKIEGVSQDRKSPNSEPENR